jgi:hypothetical protein
MYRRTYKTYSVHLYVISKHRLVALFVGWMVSDHLLLRHFGPYMIVFMNVRLVTTVAMVMILRDFKSCLLSVCWLVGDHVLLRDIGPYLLYI